MADADPQPDEVADELWTHAVQQRRRDRAAWLAAQASGDTLDVAAPRTVDADLTAAVATRVVVGEGGHDIPGDGDDRTMVVDTAWSPLPFDDDSFDTVLLDGVLERVDKPEAVLAEAARLVRPGGTVALVVPFGMQARTDDQRVFYPAGLLDLVGGHLAVRSIELVNRELRLVATDGALDATVRAQLLASVQPDADRVVLAVERAESDGRASVRELARRSRQLADRERQLARLQTALERAEQRIENARARQDELTFQRDRWRWQFESLKNRRPLRLLVEVKRAVGDPRALLRLPRTIVDVLFGPPTAPSVGRPERTGTLPGPTAEQTEAERRRALEMEMQLLAPRPPVSLRDLRVAGVLDTFTEQSFAPECELVTFRPDNWEAVLSRQPPHLLFVESAWQGNGGAWQYQVGSYSYTESVGLPHLSALVAWCRERNIPTVFWNKEDPVHFDKFKQAAQLFDVVLTSDADCIARYRALPRLRAETVEALPFAAQPRLHNPVTLRDTREPVPAFGGTYYRNRHPERRAQLEMLLDAARPSGLVIYDRTFGQESDSVGFPERFVPHIRGGLPYDQMVDAYRHYRVFLNANSVFQSPTMFSRRVYELLACGTPVVSTPSVGMEQLFGDIVALVDDEQTARATIDRLLADDELWRERSAAGIRRVHGQHTYAHRLSTVARLAGYDIPPYGDERIAVLLLADDDPARAIDSIVAQSERPAEIVVGATGAPVPTDVTVVEQSADAPRHERLRALAAQTDAPWALIADSRETYGLDLLGDLAVARRWADADVIGVVPDHGTSLPGHRFVDAVAGHGVLTRTELVRRHGWHDRDADVGAQADLRALGARIYAVR